MTPIDALLKEVEWIPCDSETSPPDDGTPYATHEGTLEIFGVSIRCARLSDGQAVFVADDVEALLSEYAGKPKCPVTISWSDEDDAFIASAIGLNGCVSDGATRSEALSNLEDAIKEWFVSAKQEGWRSPYRPE